MCTLCKSIGKSVWWHCQGHMHCPDSQQEKPPWCSGPGVAGSIPGFSIKPLSVSLRVLPSYYKHTNHKPSRRYWFLPRESHKKFFDSQQISYIILRNQVTCLPKIALVSRITIVTKENGLFILEKWLLFFRKGYERSEKRHGAREKGHGAREKGHGAAPF